MARQAQTATAVLGALSVEPMTGYEIRQAIATVLGHFWHESFGQIYPCLAGLEEDGLVTRTPGDRPRSSRYELTDAGRDRLAELLTEPPVPQPPRNGVLLRVFFGDALPPETLAQLLDEQAASARERLAMFAEIRAQLAGEPQYAAHAPYWDATVRLGELAAEAVLQWVAETQEAVGPPATMPAS